MESKNSKKRAIGKGLGDNLRRLRDILRSFYLYRKRLMLILGVFSKGTVTTSTLLMRL